MLMALMIMIMDLWLDGGRVVGLVLGLRLAKSMAVQTLHVELDSRVVCNMVEMRHTHCLWLRPLSTPRFGKMGRA